MRKVNHQASKHRDRDLSPEKTNAILDGAMQEFLSHGYAATSMDRVATAAGVSKATIYRHFGDKEGLFTTLVHRLAPKKDLFVLQHANLMTGTPRDSLRQLALCMLENVADDPQVLTFMRIIIGESERFPNLARTFVKDIEKPILEMLTHYFATQPELDVPDAEVAARMFVGTMVHFVIMRDLLKSGDLLPMECDRLLDNMLTMLVDRNLKSPQ